MPRLHPNIKKLISSSPTAVTIGNFDGQHAGHRRLFSDVLDCAAKANALSVVFSFLPHPSALFGSKEPHWLITSYDERRDFITNTGVDIFIEHPFTQDFAEIEPGEFVDFLYNELNCRYILVGKNYRFGKKRRGDVSFMQKHCLSHGIELNILTNIEIDGMTVSSSAIRELILNKDFKRAEKMLLAPYGITLAPDSVCTQKPTAFNLPNEKFLPPDGKYPVTIVTESGKADAFAVVSNKDRLVSIDGGFIDTHTPIKLLFS